MGERELTLLERVEQGVTTVEDAVVVRGVMEDGNRLAGAFGGVRCMALDALDALERGDLAAAAVWLRMLVWTAEEVG